MADGTKKDQERGLSRLGWWICFSGTLHVLIFVTLLLVPPSTARRRIPAPVYTVDLVGGAGFEGELSPASLSEKPPPVPEAVDETPIEPEEIDDPVAELPVPEAQKPKPLAEAPVPIPLKSEKVPTAELVAPLPLEKPEKDKSTQEVVQEEQEKQPEKKIETAQKPEKVKEKKPDKVKEKKPRKVVKKKAAPAPRQAERKQAERDSRARQRLRERRIQAAVAKAQERAAQRRRNSTLGRGTPPPQVAGVGRARGGGTGIGVGDGRGRGGGVVKGLEFLVYRDRMLNQIKSRWIWVGKREDLEVTVRFGVDSAGRIFALEVVGTSGDASYDDSVVRAVKRASPLPPPPVNYAGDFSDVELTFRPRDLNG